MLVKIYCFEVCVNSIKNEALNRHQKIMLLKELLEICVDSLQENKCYIYAVNMCIFVRNVFRNIFRLSEKIGQAVKRKVKFYKKSIMKYVSVA